MAGAASNRRAARSGRAAANGAQRIEVTSRAEWRRWLVRHHAQTESIWLVRWRKGAGPHVAYDDVVEEALCFGWIDSVPRKLDGERSMLLLSPRRPGSGWSAVNKARIAKLRAAGAMTPAGEAAIAAAKACGAWTRLDGVESLVLPPDLGAALDAAAGARAYFERFPPSSRRAILEWIATAKTAETRARRIGETARLAARNIKANFPEGRNAGPRPPAPEQNLRRKSRKPR